MTPINLSLPYLYKLYDKINVEAFGGKLPRITLKIGRSARKLGCFRYPVSIPGTPAENLHRCIIIISNAFDRVHEDYRDTLAHEMIHAYIWLAAVKEPQHGPMFRKMMSDINERCGYNISVRTENYIGVSHESARKSCFVIIYWQNGSRTITRVASTYVFKFHKILTLQPYVETQEWYCSFDPWFGRYPAVRTPKFFRIADDEFNSYVKRAVPLEFAGNVLRPK